MKKTFETSLVPENMPAVKRDAKSVKAKKPYRKPTLKRLGLLKSVAGSGITW